MKKLPPYRIVNSVLVLPVLELYDLIITTTVISIQSHDVRRTASRALLHDIPVEPFGKGARLNF